MCVWCVAMLLSHIMCMRCVNVFNNDDDDEDDYTNANRIKLICSCVYKGEITSSKLLVCDILFSVFLLFLLARSIYACPTSADKYIYKLNQIKWARRHTLDSGGSCVGMCVAHIEKKTNRLCLFVYVCGLVVSLVFQLWMLDLELCVCVAHAKPTDDPLSSRACQCLFAFIGIRNSQTLIECEK